MKTFEKVDVDLELTILKMVIFIDYFIVTILALILKPK